MFGVRGKDDVVSANDVLPELARLYAKERKSSAIHFKLTAKAGERVCLCATDSEGNSATVYGNVPQAAINRPSDMASAEKQLSKLGDTIYSFGGVEGEIEDGLMISAAEFNRLRREVTSSLDSARVEANTPKYTINSNYPTTFPKLLNIKIPQFRIQIRTAEQLNGISDEVLEKLQFIILPVKECLKISDNSLTQKIICELPRYTINQDCEILQLKQLRENGFEHLYCQNVSHLRIGKSLGFTLHGGFGLNISNSSAMKNFAEYGMNDAVISFEAKLTQISKLGDFMKYGVIVSGNLPLMLTRNCPIRNVKTCAECRKSPNNRYLHDRTGRKFKVICDGTTSQILNSENLYMADRLREVRDVSFFLLMFTDETGESVNRTLSEYLSGVGTSSKNDITRGLYYRGIE